MGRQSKEFHAFTSLADQLLTVPKDEIVRRVEAERPRLREPTTSQSQDPR